MHSARMRWVALGLIALAVMTTVGFVREALRTRQIDREISALKEEAVRLRARNFEISALHASLANGEFAEREARVKLNLQKEGERAVVLRKESASLETAPAEEPPAPAWSNPEKWWKYFTDRKALDAYARTVAKR